MGENPLTYPVTLRRRTPAGSLRYLADQLDAGQDLGLVAMALQMLMLQWEQEAGVAPSPDLG